MAEPESTTARGPASGVPATAEWVEERLIPGRNATKADVRLGRIRGRAVAIKDYRPRALAVRSLLGRWLVARETRAYRAAEGAEGLPRLLGRCGPYALVLERVEGASLAECAPGTLDAALFDRLDAVVADLHARGVAHGDLHHRDVLIASDGGVRVVDLATAWVRGRTPWSRWVFARLRDQDRVALARLRARFTGADEDAAAAAVGGRAAAWHARGRRWKRLLDRARGRGA